MSQCGGRIFFSLAFWKSGPTLWCKQADDNQIERLVISSRCQRAVQDFIAAAGVIVSTDHHI